MTTLRMKVDLIAFDTIVVLVLCAMDNWLMWRVLWHIGSFLYWPTLGVLGMVILWWCLEGDIYDYLVRKDARRLVKEMNRRRHTFRYARYAGSTNPPANLTRLVPPTPKETEQ